MSKTPSRQQLIVLGVLAMLLATGAANSTFAQPHPQKSVYSEVERWPATAPGAVVLQDFVPFRAVYDREYTQGSGPGAGEKRQDRVIVHAEEVGWEGRRAVVIQVIDSAAAEYTDTNMRSLTMVAALDDLRVLFEIGPVPGKAKDYYLGLFTDEGALVSQVATEAQTFEPRKIPTGHPGYGPGSWVMANLPLEEGLKIHLAPYFSPQANPISQSSYGRVLGRKALTDGSGDTHEAWVVETSGWYSLESPKVLRLYLQNRPPYYLGTEIYNYDEEKGKKLVWLRSFQVLTP